MNSSMAIAPVALLITQICIRALYSLRYFSFDRRTQ